MSEDMKCFICGEYVETPPDFDDVMDEAICDDCMDEHAEIIEEAKNMAAGRTLQ